MSQGRMEMSINRSPNIDTSSCVQAELTSDHSSIQHPDVGETVNQVDTVCNTNHTHWTFYISCYFLIGRIIFLRYLVRKRDGTHLVVHFCFNCYWYLINIYLFEAFHQKHSVFTQLHAFLCRRMPIQRP